jgi:hypothetical protein
MRQTRRSRLITAFFALVSVLFMQLAVAAYACPTLQAGQPVNPVAMSLDVGEHESMVGCEGMVDTEQPSLCHAHSRVGNQSLDKPAVPDVTPSLAIMLVPAVGDLDIAFRPVSTHAQSSWLMRGSAPPLSIRNCCFRI